MKFYKTCFAHPAVVAITWWDLCDRGSWLKGSGMLRADMSPKPVYTALKRLIHQQWMTHLKGTTGRDGRFTFRGFRGNYAVTVSVGGRQVRAIQKLTRDAAKNLWTIRVRASAPSARPVRGR